MRDRGRSTLAALATCILCLAASSPAASNPPASSPPASNPGVGQDGGDVAEARLHFARGLTLYNAAQYEGARAEIERAYAIAPSYRLLYDLALCCNGQGDRVAAVGYLEQYLAEGGAEIEPARRAEADDLLSHLRARVASVTIRTNVSGEAAVVVDDQPRGPVSTRPLVLLPGTRKIWVTKAGYYPASHVLLLKEGDGIEAAFELKELPRAAEARRPWWRDRRVRWSALTAFVLLGAGFVVVRLRSSRKKGTPTTGIVHLNPYQGDADGETSQPTPEHTNVIRVDPASSNPGAAAPLALVAGAATDIGLVKPSNEDSHLVDQEKGLFVVADGIGGFAGGGVASTTAVETIAEVFRAKIDVGLLTHLPRPAAELATAMFAANTAIRQKAAANLNIADMGSTCVAARFCLETRELFVAHVGDSRVYRLRAGRLEQVTTDHTMAELGVTGRRAEHLSRALGTEASPKLDVLLLRPELHDLYLFCCDGLTKMVSHAALTQVLSRTSSPSTTVADLVSSANAQGGKDNITAIVVRVVQRS